MRSKSFRHLGLFFAALALIHELAGWGYSGEFMVMTVVCAATWSILRHVEAQAEAARALAVDTVAAVVRQAYGAGYGAATGYDIGFDSKDRPSPLLDPDWVEKRDLALTGILNGFVKAIKT